MLLGVYVFSAMKIYAISYTGGDTWFTTFAVIVVAVPIAEIFCILGQTLVAPMIPVGSSTRSGGPQEGGGVIIPRRRGGVRGLHNSTTALGCQLKDCCHDGHVRCPQRGIGQGNCKDH